MKKKKVLITLSIVGIFILSIIIYNYLNPDRVVIASGKSEEYVNDRTFSLMLETERGSGEYQVSNDTTWPGSGYEYNASLSKCENGSQLIWNDETNSVTLKANISDKCYLYFDIVPPDVTLATTNTGYGATPATLSCTGAESVYNPLYQRIEISNIANKYTSCNLTYQISGTKNYLNNYITSLSGSTQGNGKVVDEINATIPFYTNSTPITQYDYRNVTMYSATSYSETSGTTNTNSFEFSGNSWNSVPGNMIDGTYYHIKFNLSTSGYYQLCYTISSGSTYGALYVLKDGNRVLYQTPKNDTSTSTCLDLGYINTTTEIRIVQDADSFLSDPIPTMTFNLQKATSTTSMDTGYRYEGKDPNNYIWFNNELWRIIGVFGEESHGQSGQNLVKIIRTNPIGGISWDKNNNNDWTQASLNQLLNGVYLNSENGTDGEYCYGYNNIPVGNCDYSTVGINDKYRPMIKNVTWYLGGHSTEGYVTATEMYGFERGTTVYNENPIKTNGYIGLMYLSDYEFSVLSDSCTRTTNFASYDNENCAGQSWLYGQGYEWTITSSSSGNIVFKISRSGHYDNQATSISEGLSSRPVLYLDSSVYVIDGNGSITNPYIIGM